jgi:tellurite resistance protein TehA-like permease
MRKKTNDALWYFYFGFGAVLIIIGFLWLFYYYSKYPYYLAKSVNESIANHSPELVVHKPPFPYVAAFSAVFGSVIFLITKYFYDKTYRNKAHRKKR